MSMRLSEMSLNGSDHHHSFPSPTIAPATSTPMILTKLETPLHQLINSGLHSPTDLPDHHFTAQHQSIDSPACSSDDAYSPTLESQYRRHLDQQQQAQQQQQQQQQQSDYTQTFSSYSETAAALSLSSFQHHQPYSTPSTQLSSSSPIMSQAELFHKQIQQDHHHHQHYQQQQQGRDQEQEQKQEQGHGQGHRFLPESLINSALATAGSTTAASAVPVMTCDSVRTSIPTPTKGSILLGLIDDQDEHDRHVREELERCHLSVVAELVAGQL
ncbi:hypothetical protein BGZ65_008776 [Modicella reniformis]|uniref:Uncharacterized protein n=1 Tax=Modicella reniformis TaxID=1440133 RepID=A0A9P6INR9_9FUNG|nr:hypothetical protein BGZ65_008776 [Modicella reniformis]